MAPEKSNSGIPDGRVIMQVSRDAFEEIKGKLEDAKFLKSIHDDGKKLDMRGIALRAEASVPGEWEEETLP